MKIISQIAVRLNIPELLLMQHLLGGARKYKLFFIPKKKGGMRAIAQPSKEIKSFQRTFLSVVKLPTSSVVYSYKEGKNNFPNASLHRENKYFLKLDFDNFFNSITPDIFWKQWKLFFPEQSAIDKILLEQLLFWQPSAYKSNLVLSVGAPSSPAISNFCLISFDNKLQSFCRQRSITFSRYADDLTFSTNRPNVLSEVLPFVQKLLVEDFDGLIRINPTKTVFTSKRHLCKVTGLVITPDRKVSIGRDNKRYIKHLIFEYSQGSLEETDVMRLKGLLSFVKSIEPNFISSLQKKYGSVLLTNLGITYVTIAIES